MFVLAQRSIKGKHHFWDIWAQNQNIWSFCFFQLIGWHTCVAIVWWFFHMPKNAGMFAVFSPWVWRCRSKQWTLRTVLKTLGFFWQVFFDFSSHLFGGQKFLVIKKPQQTRGELCPTAWGLWRLEGGEIPALWTWVNHIPPWRAQKKRRVVLGSTQDSFLFRRKIPVGTDLTETKCSIFSFEGSLGCQFCFCYLSSSQLTSFATITGEDWWFQKPMESQPMWN